jgi:hypothetical protein
LFWEVGFCLLSPRFQPLIHIILNPIRLTQWATSSLNLLDKLSISTNRFVQEFERYGRVNNDTLNIGLALGVLRAAKEEYALGLAVDYHLSVSAAVFGGLLDEASYLLKKSYLRAAAVLIGAALEEGLKTRARSVPLSVGPKETLTPLIHKLKAPDVGILNEFQAKQLEAIATLRNDAAHGGDFHCSAKDVEDALKTVETVLRLILTTG